MMMMIMMNKREGGLHVCFHSSTCCRFVISGDKNSLTVGKLQFAESL